MRPPSGQNGRGNPPLTGGVPATYTRGDDGTRVQGAAKAPRPVPAEAGPGAGRALEHHRPPRARRAGDSRGGREARPPARRDIVVVVVAEEAPLGAAERWREALDLLAVAGAKGD